MYVETANSIVLLQTEHLQQLVSFYLLIYLKWLVVKEVRKCEEEVEKRNNFLTVKITSYEKRSI